MNGERTQESNTATEWSAEVFVAEGNELHQSMVPEPLGATHVGGLQQNHRKNNTIELSTKMWILCLCRDQLVRLVT